MRLFVVFIRHKCTMVLDEDCNINRIAGCLVTDLRPHLARILVTL